MNNLEKILDLFRDDPDLRIRELKCGTHNITIVHLDGLADVNRLSDYTTKSVLTSGNFNDLDDLVEKSIYLINLKKESSLSSMTEKFLAGFSLLFMDKNLDAIILDTQVLDGRSVIEPPTSSVTKGPREGFIENIRTNINLMRKRLRSDSLKLKMLKVGKYTSTAVAVMWIDKVAPEKVVNEITKKIEGIDIDGIIDSSYVATYLDSRRSTLFKTAGSTEKPDIAAAKMLEGRVIIIVDGSPIVLSLPYMFVEEVQTSQDYYGSPQAATTARYIRVIAVIGAVLIPAIYVSMQVYNYQIIPQKFLVTIMNATQAIPFSPLTEMVLVLLLFDILREANFRMPRFEGLALSVVGAVVLGDAAVKAGLLGAPAVMIGAMSGLGLYAIPDNTLLFTILRLALTIIAGIMGFFGLIIAMLMILTYTASFTGYGTPYLAPYAPDVPLDRKDAITKQSLRNLSRRPRSLNSENHIRIKNDSREE